MSRGLRVSWAVLPARFRAAMTGYLDASGEEVSQVSAAFLASFIATGALTRHRSRAMRTYRARQARFVAACREHIPAARDPQVPAGREALDGLLDDHHGELAARIKHRRNFTQAQAWDVRLRSRHGTATWQSCCTGRDHLGHRPVPTVTLTGRKISSW